MWCQMSAVVVALLLAVVDAASVGHVRMEALPDPLALMMPSDADALQQMPMARRLAELEGMYAHVYEAQAMQTQSGRRHVVELQDASEKSLLTIDCVENDGEGESMIADDFRLGDSVASSEQVVAIRRCQCTGSVVGERGSVVEMSLCGRVS